MEAEHDKWHTPTGQRIYITDDKQFLALPAAIEFTGLKRGSIHQQITSNKIPNEDYIKEDKYVFISMNHLDKVRDHSSRIKKLIHLEEKYHVKFNDGDIEEFVKWKLKKDAEKSAAKIKKEDPKVKKTDAKKKKAVK